MKLRAIAESLLLELQGRVEIVPWTDEPYDFDYDPWVAADQADQIASKSGIRIDSTKELSWIAVNEADDVVGALWSHLSNDDPPVFDFDVAVDPDWRSGRLGLQLIDNAIEDLRAHQSEFPGTYARVWVVNPKLVRVLENRYGFEIESQHSDGSAHMIFN
jgi:ribosomal protein S18 acetylase RimI-like enzyme